MRGGGVEGRCWVVEGRAGEEDGVVERGAEAVGGVLEGWVELDAEVAGAGGSRGGFHGPGEDGRGGEGEAAGPGVGEGEAEVRPEIDRVGDRADDLGEEDAIDPVVGVEAEVVDGGVARRIGLRAVEIAGPGRGVASGACAPTEIAVSTARPN